MQKPLFQVQMVDSKVKMGTYIEEIAFPLGEEEARVRINKWRENAGKDFKLLKKGSDWILIKHKTMHFHITFLSESVKIEGWVGGFTKYSVDPKAIVGGIARRQGWSVYETLRDAFIINSSDLPDEGPKLK